MNAAGAGPGCAAAPCAAIGWADPMAIRAATAAVRISDVVMTHTLHDGAAALSQRWGETRRGWDEPRQSLTVSATRTRTRNDPPAPRSFRVKVTQACNFAVNAYLCGRYYVVPAQATRHAPPPPPEELAAAAERWGDPSLSKKRG